MSDAQKKAKYQKVAYYPGCALEGTAHAYNVSTVALGRKLGLEVEVRPAQMPDGADPVPGFVDQAEGELESPVHLAGHRPQGLVLLLREHRPPRVRLGGHGQRSGRRRRE